MPSCQFGFDRTVVTNSGVCMNQQDPSYHDQGAFSWMFRDLYEGLYGILENGKYASSLARYMRDFYEALIVNGFTKEEALQILLSTGNPVSQGKKNS